MTSRGAARPNGQSQASKICQFKLVLLGESAVGKSSLVLRFVKGQFHEYQESTIGGESARGARCGCSCSLKERAWAPAAPSPRLCLAPVLFPIKYKPPLGSEPSPCGHSTLDVVVPRLQPVRAHLPGPPIRTLLTQSRRDFFLSELGSM